MKHMQKSLYAAGLILLVIILLFSASCQSGASVLPKQAPLSAEEQNMVDEMDKYLSNLTKTGNYSGSVLISKDGKVLLSKGYGFSDREKKTLNTPQTRFPLFFGTMPFTSLAIYLLVQDGKLSLEDPICQYLDDCPASWEKFTIFHLLYEEKNLPDYDNTSQFKKSRTEPVSVQELIRNIESIKYTEELGLSTREGISDYILLGGIIECVSGKSYEDFIKERIFEPVGMKNTGLLHRNGLDDQLAILYKFAGETSFADTVDFSHYFSALGMYSTVEDIYLFLQALDNSELLPKDALEKYFTQDNFSSEMIISKNGWTYMRMEGKPVRFIHPPGSKWSTYRSIIGDEGNHQIFLVNQENFSGLPGGLFIDILYGYGD